MKQLIIIEGNDNSGKDTLINYLTKHFQNSIVYHSIAPSSSDFECAAKEQYNFFIKLIDSLMFDNHETIIFNRAWQGEYVYGTLYRGRTKEDVLEDINYFDKTIDNAIFANKLNKVSYIQLIADPQVLSNNEDGLSISGGNTEKILEEKKLFEEVYDKSTLRKMKIDVTYNGKYRNKKFIYKEALDFINS